MRLRWQTSKIKLDEGRFIKAVSDKLAIAMMASAKDAFRDTFHRIPVWTGESRGGMRATARALGLEDLLRGDFNPRALKHRRKNRFGKFKGPASAQSAFVPPRRVQRSRMEMFIKNEADGFVVADKRAQKNTGPWKFAASFSRAFRKHLLKAIAADPNLPIKSFMTRQRALKRG